MLASSAFPTTCTSWHFCPAYGPCRQLKAGIPFRLAGVAIERKDGAGFESGEAMKVFGEARRGIARPRPCSGVLCSELDHAAPPARRNIAESRRGVLPTDDGA